MLSRVADAVYWMNRYMERAENVARFVDVSFHLALDLPTMAASPWGALVAATGDDALFRERFGEPEQRTVLRFLTFDREYPSSVVSCLAKARENALRSREQVSTEVWQQVNEAYLLAKEAEAAFGAAPEDRAPYELFAAVKKACHAFVGTTYMTMSHDEAWHFGRIGRLLERADKTSRILDVKSYLIGEPGGSGPRLEGTGDGATRIRAQVPGRDEIEWAALLRSASAFEMYRRQHGALDRHKVLDFLVLDRTFPRSMLYCVRKAEESLRTITGTPFDGRATHAERAIGRLHADLEFLEVRDLLARGLNRFVMGFQEELNAVGDAIASSFFLNEEPSSEGQAQE